MTVELQEPCYIARKRECGCIVAIVSDADDYRAQASKALARWAKQGFVIERIEAEAFRNGSAGKFRCQCATNSLENNEGENMEKCGLRTKMQRGFGFGAGEK